MDNKLNLPYLDDIVLQSLDYFNTHRPPRINLNTYDLPFVIGSGNAYNTGRILFSNKAAIFADESTMTLMINSYKQSIEKGYIKDAIIISASGEKDSVWELELAKKMGLSTTLLTTNKNSTAAKIADKIYAFQSIAEPYTYNTSTYMGMILSITKEDVTKITEYIESIVLPENFNQYSAFSFIVPDIFSLICPMLDIKKDELFGPFVSIRSFSEGEARHAKFINRTPQELVISLTGANDFYGIENHRYSISMPAHLHYAAVMAITYYLIGKIQRIKPPYFMDNINLYVSELGPRAYGKSKAFDLIVPGTS